jgi:hypothetical protein
MIAGRPPHRTNPSAGSASVHLCTRTAQIRFRIRECSGMGEVHRSNTNRAFC